MNQVFDVTGDGERLDSFLAAKNPGQSRGYWQKLIGQGAVSINGRVVKSSRKVNDGEQVTVAMPKKIDFAAQTLPVLYEDDDVVVMNKPAGMLTHAKGAQSEEFSVGEFMRPRTTDGPETNRPGIVHRLDRGTSGVIIAAKNPAAKRWLQKQFSLRKVKKTYVALVHGHPKESAATIQLPIERNPKKPQTFRVGGNGKPAETAYETLQNYQKYTLLKLMPHTGRTHQLRVHLNYLNCPIVGDEFYGKKEPKLGRMFLHAANLELTLPSRERKTFQAPLPPELQHYLDTLI
jgi:23S rRNA pseudouridine1911/1915/1917 synthase